MFQYSQACVKFQEGFPQFNIHRIPWVKKSVNMET